MIKKILLLIIFPLVIACQEKSPIIDKEESLYKNISDIIKESKNTSKSDSLRNDYLFKANEKIEKLNNDSLKIRTYIKIAYCHFLLGNLEEFKKGSLKVLNSHSIKNDFLNAALANEYLGYYYQINYKPDSAFYYYNKSLFNYNSINDELNSARVLLSMGTIQESVKDYTGGEINSIKAILKLKNSSKDRTLYLAYNNLAVIYNKLGKYKLAIENHQNAIKLLKKLDDKYLEAMSLNNIGRVYSMKNDFKESIKYYNKALETKNLFENQSKTYAMLLDNLAYSNFELGIQEDIPDLFYKALQIRDSLNIKDGQVVSNIHISEYFQSKNDTLKAILYLNTAKVIAKESNYNEGLLESYLLLSKLEPAKEGKEYLSKYIQLSDSLQLAERVIREKFTRIAYETDEITKEKEEEEKKNWLLTITLIIGAAFSTLVFIYIRQRSKNKELELNKKQDQANVEIYNLMLSQQSKFQEGSNKEKERIAEELHDGILGRLFGTRLSLDSLNEGVKEEEIKEREEYIEELNLIEEDIRKISHNLKTSLFSSNSSFRKLVEELVTKQSKIGNFECELNFKNSIDWENISNSIKINCYRIIQESLQNIIKYAEASEVVIEFYEEDKNLILSVKDNGIGYVEKNKNTGIGQKNMISRAKSLNGKIEFSSSLGEGTEIIMKIPR